MKGECVCVNALMIKMNIEYKNLIEINTCFNLTNKCLHYIQNKDSSEIISLYTPV